MTLDADLTTSSNPSDNPALSSMLGRGVGRRQLLAGGLGAMALTFVGRGRLAGATTVPEPTTPDSTAGGSGAPTTSAATTSPAATETTASASTSRILGFTGVPVSTADEVVVPDGYVAQVLIPWGTPLQSSGPAWKPDASNTAEEQAQQVGYNHDGIFFFPSEDANPSTRGLLVLNHEYTDPVLLYPDGDVDLTMERVAKALEAHGVTVIEIELVGDEWKPVDSDKNRRITMTTPVEFSGPAAEHPGLEANDAPMGTLNNCGAGITPWGTYLTCEENWHQYFGTADEEYEVPAELARYGVETETDYRWHQGDPRFDIAVNPNEPNRFGWVVEIDPQDPASTPVKRTALGRFKHESAWVHDAAGTIVVYSGDDEDSEYLYKFVSAAPWQATIDAGDSPLDEGILYVARFNDDGSGDWMPLIHGRDGLGVNGGFADQADVLMRTREAADRLGATKLDRPEWIGEDLGTGDVYVTFTNGTNGPNPLQPRDKNPYGQIVKVMEVGGDHTGTRFEWDIFVLAGDPAVDPESTVDGDVFGSPDGLWIDPDRRMWIETDISNSSQTLAEKGYDTIGNNALLAADLETGEIRRFLTGPRGCEITGLHMTPDRTTMFINVQHPGEATKAWGEPTADEPTLVSSWPDGSGRPRSATLAIRRADGGVIGAP